jgi:hypothetical protein
VSLDLSLVESVDLGFSSLASTTMSAQDCRTDWIPVFEIKSTIWTLMTRALDMDPLPSCCDETCCLRLGDELRRSINEINSVSIFFNLLRQYGHAPLSEIPLQVVHFNSLILSSLSCLRDLEFLVVEDSFP